MRDLPDDAERLVSTARVQRILLPDLLHNLSLESGQAVLYCAHRTSTASSCAFCEQEGHLAAPSPSFGGRALREQLTFQRDTSNEL